MHAPTVLLVGPLAGQAQLMRDAFKGLDIRSIASGRTINRMRGALGDVDHVVILLGFVNHKHIDTARAHHPRVELVPGRGMTRVREHLAKIESTHAARAS